MDRPDRHALPPFLGDADGLRWVACVPEEHRTDETGLLDVPVSGDVIGFMWDYGVQVPLWDREGKLPDEPEWLREVLMVSDDLIRDMAAWGDYMDRLDSEPAIRTEGAMPEMDRQGRVLADRLQAELGSRYRVQYRPW